MTLPTPFKNSRYTATVPRLNGGLDCQSGGAHIEDNAVSAVENLWWRQGALRTRPGVHIEDLGAVALGEDATVRAYEDGDRVLLVVHAGGNLRVYHCSLLQPSVSGELLLEATTSTAAFCVKAAGEWAQHYSWLLFAENRIWGFESDTLVVRELTGAIYVPLVLTDATPLKAQEDSRTGTVLESENLLTPWFRCEYRSDGVGTQYRLPRTNLTGAVTVEWRDTAGSYYAEIPAAADSAAFSNGMVANVDRKTGWFWFDEGGGAPLAVAAADTCNITITAARTFDGSERATVFEAETACWFGGKRSGIAGGTRLFLGNGSKLLWSALENPFYFPADNYVYVGDPDQAITALHRQGERLVIFKPREVYSAEHESVSDSTRPAHTAAFPLTPLQDDVGCDLPRTVALRGNRLVWACSDGAVYTLSAFGSLTQPSVTKLSAAVEPLLQETGAPVTASAAMEDGVYWLQWDEKLLVLCEGDSPTWYRFTLPETGLSLLWLFTARGKLRIPALFYGSGGETLFWLTLQGQRDQSVTLGETGFVYTEHPIPTMVCTKSYDMGEPHTYKQVLGIAAEVTADSAVRVTCLTERGEISLQPATPTADGLMRLAPAIDRCRRLAVKLQGDNLRVDSLAIQLRGGMR